MNNENTFFDLSGIEKPPCFGFYSAILEECSSKMCGFATLCKSDTEAKNKTKKENEMENVKTNDAGVDIISETATEEIVEESKETVNEETTEEVKKTEAVSVGIVSEEHNESIVCKTEETQVNSSSTFWVVRAGKGGKLFSNFKTNNIIGVDWRLVGNLSSIKTRDEMKGLIQDAYPDYKKGKTAIVAGQLLRFCQEFKIGDYVLVYNPKERNYIVGNITSDYIYNNSIADFCNIREVNWITSINRDDLSVTTKNTLGGIATIFKISEAAKLEILGIIKAY